jgi:hypothetical protein
MYWDKELKVQEFKGYRFPAFRQDFGFWSLNTAEEAGSAFRILKV